MVEIFGYSPLESVLSLVCRRNNGEHPEGWPLVRRLASPANPFWRNTRLEKHENDPLNTDPPTPPPAAPRDIVCGACGCKIARSGEILKTGETYKAFLKHEQTIEGKDREIAALTAENAALKTEVSTLKAQGSGGGSASGHRPGGRIQ